MTIPKKPRYRFVYESVYRFLVECTDEQLPLNPFLYITSKNWRLISYTEHINGMANFRTQVPRPAAPGVTVYFKDIYTIFYDESQPLRRINFTLAHEIAHIYLNHLTDFDYSKMARGLLESEYLVLEKEADVFAKNILAPIHIIDRFDLNIKGIYTLFNIGIQAAINRYRTLESDFKYFGYKKLKYIKQRHSGFLQKYRDFNKCCLCGFLLIKKSYNHCPVCGGKTGTKTDSENFSMIYNSIQTTAGMRLKSCPVCENEQLSDEDNYCAICGAEVVNRCSNDSPCSKRLDANARYCPECGKKSVFFERGFLDEWTCERGYIAVPKK